MFSKLAYAMLKKWEIKLCVSVNIYCRLPKLGMGTHCFQNYPVLLTKKWVIKLCISVNIYHRFPKLRMSTHVFKINLFYHKK